MDTDFWLKTMPYISLALVLAGWAITDFLQTRKQDIDFMSLTIWLTGTAGTAYMILLAVNYAPVDVRINRALFEIIRWCLLLSLFGVPSVWINVKRAWMARRRGLYRKLVPDQEEGVAE